MNLYPMSKDSNEYKEFVRKIAQDAQAGILASFESYNALTQSDIEHLLEFSIKNGFFHIAEKIEPMAVFLIGKGYEGYNRYLSLRREFPKIDPEYLIGLDKYPIVNTKFGSYLRMCQVFQDECKNTKARNQYAYKAFILFETPEKFAKYVQQNVKGDLKCPNITAINGIRFPHKGAWPNIDFREWGSAFLQHGKTLVNGLFFYASEWVSPSRIGKSISLKDTWQSYFCLSNGFDFDDATQFQITKEIEKWNPSPRHIQKLFAVLSQGQEHPILARQVPDIYLTEEETNIPGVVFKKTDRQDMRNFFMGKYTDCCEWVGGKHDNYNTSPEHAFFTGESGYFIFEDTKTGDVIAHSWAWRSNYGDLIFDGFESRSKKLLSCDELLVTLDLVLERLAGEEFNDYEINKVYLGSSGASFSDLNKMSNCFRSHAKPLFDFQIGPNMQSELPSLILIQSENGTRHLDMM